jgi:hypothetical protein
MKYRAKSLPSRLIRGESTELRMGKAGRTEAEKVSILTEARTTIGA